MCEYMSVSLQSPSNQKFCRQIAGYWMSVHVGDHRVA